MIEPAEVEVLRAAGAVFDEKTGVPFHFGDVAAEYQALDAAAGLARLDTDHVEVTGSDRAKFIHNFCTNEIKKLPAGAGCEAFFLNPKGKVIDYGVVHALADSIWIDLEAGRGLAMVKHLDRFLFREDVQLYDRSASLARLFLSGPNAAGVLADLVGPAAELPADSRVVAVDVAGHPCQLRRGDRSRRPGYDLICPAQSAASLWSKILQSGASHGLRPVGEAAMEIARIEIGLPRFGRDVTEDNLPQELGRDARAISFTKGCYIGQETVARLDAYGHVNKLLRGLAADPGVSIESGQSVRKGEKNIGAIASTATSPRLGKRIALAVLRTVGGEPGAVVLVDSQIGPVEATVCPLPFD